MLPCRRFPISFETAKLRMRSEITQRLLEEKLARLCGRRHAIFVSRATVALFLALKALPLKKGSKVVVPSIVCPNVPSAVLYSGFQPIFCDVSKKDFNIDLGSLEKLLRGDRDIRAVIVPHMYGHPTDLQRLTVLCRKRKVALIEDIALSLGGRYQGKPLGSFGEFSVVSFGHTKIIDENGGGAILFDNVGSRKKILDEIRKLPNHILDERLREMYRAAYIALMPLARADQRLAGLYSSFPAVFKDLYLTRHFDANIIGKIYAAFTDLPSIVEKRNTNAAFYKKHLTHPAIVHPTYQGEGVHWRYSFLIKGDQQIEIAEKMRKKGIDVSNWYYPTHLLYSPGHTKLPNSEYVGAHVFNLWVNPEMTKEALEKNVEVVLSVVRETYGE